VMIKESKLSPLEKQTIVFFLVATFFNSMIGSVSNVQDIIARKALSALDWHITLLAMIWPLSNFFSIWWGKILEQSPHKSKFFLFVAFAGRLPLVFSIFIDNIYHFMFFLIVMLSFNSLLLPAQNSLIQSNFRPSIRGKLFGISVSLATFVTVIFSYFAGKLLDINESAFRYLLILAGLSGFIGAIILYFVPFGNQYVSDKRKINYRELILSPLIRTSDLLKKNQNFAYFERNFMIYGIGFLILVPVIPVFLVDNLKMDYSSTFLAKGVIAQLGLLIFSPVAGKFHDIKHPFLFMTYAFGTLAIFPLLLFISFYVNTINIAVIIVFAAYLIYGIAMSNINISWNLGSIYFAGEEDASMYQSVHVTLTGIRGILMPLLSLLIMRTLGISAVFVVSFFALLTASFLSYKRFRVNIQKKKLFN